VGRGSRRARCGEHGEAQGEGDDNGGRSGAGHGEILLSTILRYTLRRIVRYVGLVFSATNACVVGTIRIRRESQ
jgi:hypothetical protein